MPVSINQTSEAENVIIPASFVQSLQEQRMRLKHEIAEREANLAHVNRQLEAVQTLAPALFGPPSGQQNFLDIAPPSEPETKPTLVSAVVKAVNAADRPIMPSEIRDLIIKQGDADLIGSQNYLYTAIKRVVDRGDIIRMSDGRYRTAAKSSSTGGNPET